jgi:succinate dehydrogenase / fumarate reductase cytochrome b subunit
MNWIKQLLTSSVGKKVIMSLAGIFLIIFLLVHLGINLTLIICDSTKPFNVASHFMGSNYLVKVFEIVLFLGFIVHMIYGVFLQIQNWMARPKRYKIDNFSQLSIFSKFMIHTAVVIGVFLVIHIMDFYFKAKFSDVVPEVSYDGGVTHYHDLASLVIAKFNIITYVVIYVVAILVLGFHLHHAFQSAFQTLGLHHEKYTKWIKACGIVYTLIMVVGFSLIPLMIYF